MTYNVNIITRDQPFKTYETYDNNTHTDGDSHSQYHTYCED